MDESDSANPDSTRRIMKSDLSNIKGRYLSGFGLVSAYLVLSGTITLFIYLRHLGLAESLARAIEPLGNVGVGIVVMASFLTNLGIVFSAYILLVLAIGTDVVWVEEVSADGGEASEGTSNAGEPSNTNSKKY